MLGWSGEVSSNKWRKVEVELDETDLQRILREYKIEEDKLTNIDRFRLLELQAENLIVYELASRFSVSEPNPTQAIAANKAEIVKIANRTTQE